LVYQAYNKQINGTKNSLLLLVPRYFSKQFLAHYLGVIQLFEDGVNLRHLFFFLLVISSNAFAEKSSCDISVEDASALIQAEKLPELENTLMQNYKKIEQASFKLTSLKQVECYAELLNSTRLLIKVNSLPKINWVEKELTSIKHVFASNTKHLWVLSNQYRNTLQNYIKFNSKARDVKKLEYGKVLLNKLTNSFGDYFTSSQLEQNVKFENMSSSCITS